MPVYYYPLCAKDFVFENIFSTESISPPNFYPNRGFGIDYFFKIQNIHHDRAIILYNKPPKFVVPEASSDVVKFYLEIEESSLLQDDFITVSEGIIAYPRTIYLTKTNFKIRFLSDKDKKITLLKSETSLPTKDLAKYYDNFGILPEDETVEVDTSKLFSLDIDNNKVEIEFDRRFNYAKGFIYALAVGTISNNTKEEITLKKWLKEIGNTYAEFRNRYENASFQSSKSSKQSSSTSLSSYESQLNNAIIKAQELLLILFPDQNNSEEPITQFLVKKFPTRFKSIEEAQLYLNFNAVNDEILGTNSLSRIKSFYHKSLGSNSINFHFEVLQNQARNYLAHGKNDRSRGYENSSDHFKVALSAINKFVEEAFLKKTEDKTPQLNGVGFDLNANSITLSDNFLSLPSKMIDEIRVIINIILKNPKRGKGPSNKESILLIIEQVGDIIGRNGKSTQLYQYIDTQVGYYSIEKASSIVMKNFVAFVFNPDSLEKLVSFNESKEIENSWIACAFWCSFNGFANTSRNFLKPIFATTNVIAQNEIDNYLADIRKQSRANFDAIQWSSVEEPKQLYKSTEESKDQTQKIISFFEKYILKKYKIRLEDFVVISALTDQNKFIDSLKEKGKMSKKDGKKIYDGFIDFMSSDRLF